MKCEICCNYLPQTSVLKAIRSSYSKHFFPRLPPSASASEALRRRGPGGGERGRPRHCSPRPLRAAPHRSAPPRARPGPAAAPPRLRGCRSPARPPGGSCEPSVRRGEGGRHGKQSWDLRIRASPSGCSLQGNTLRLRVSPLLLFRRCLHKHC